MRSCIDNKVEPKFRHTGLKVSEKKGVPELQFGTCECLCVYHTGNRANRIDDKFCNFSHAFCLNFEYQTEYSVPGSTSRSTYPVDMASGRGQ